VIDGLKPYPAMKDSGVPWLGEVPKHWTVDRGKTLFRCVDVRSSSGEEELLTVSSAHGVVPRSSVAVTMFKAESYIGYKLCWPGDLVINSLWAWGRGLGVSRQHGIVSSAYGVYRLRPLYSRYPAYIHELVRSTPFQWELQVRSKGIWISRLQLTDEAFLGAPFPVPPCSEQAAIVRFLEHAAHRIRRYIRAKQKLIKLLEEQKQAIIQRAVTRGLDPDVRLKPSGVEWLGDVPKHWDVRRIASFSPKITNGWVGPTRDILKEKGIPYVQSLHIKRGKIRFEKKYFVDAQWLERHPKVRLRQGDVVVVQTGDIGQVACVTQEFDGAGCHALIIIRTDLRVVGGEFLDLVLRSRYGYESLKSIQTGALHPHLNCTWVREMFIPVPPIREQTDILRAVFEATQSLERAIEDAERAVLLLRECHTRLIADVVTGKLDVREASAQLPEATEAPEVSEEADSPGEAEYADGADTDGMPEEEAES